MAVAWFQAGQTSNLLTGLQGVRHHQGCSTEDCLDLETDRVMPAESARFLIGLSDTKLHEGMHWVRWVRLHYAIWKYYHSTGKAHTQVLKNLIVSLQRKCMAMFQDQPADDRHTTAHHTLSKVLKEVLHNHQGGCT